MRNEQKATWRGSKASSTGILTAQKTPIWAMKEYRQESARVPGGTARRIPKKHAEIDHREAIPVQVRRSSGGRGRAILGSTYREIG